MCGTFSVDESKRPKPNDSEWKLKAETLERGVLNMKAYIFVNNLAFAAQLRE